MYVLLNPRTTDCTTLLRTADDGLKVTHTKITSVCILEGTFYVICLHYISKIYFFFSKLLFSRSAFALK